MKRRRIHGLRGLGAAKGHGHDYALTTVRAIKKLDSVQEDLDSLVVDGNCASGAKALRNITQRASAVLCEVAQVDPRYHGASSERAQEAVDETLELRRRIHGRPDGLIYSIEKARGQVDRCYAEAAGLPYRHVPPSKSLVSNRQEPLFPGASKYRSPFLEF